MTWRNYFESVAQSGSLILTLAKRDVQIKYAQSLLGIFWVLIQPLVGVALFTLVIGHSGGLPRWRDRVGLALLLGIEAFSDYAEYAHPGYRMYLIGWMAWGLMLYAAVAGLWLLADAARGIESPADGQVAVPLKKPSKTVKQKKARA